MTMTFAPSAAFAPLACPRCAGEMVQEPRSGILVDRCTGCRGVFLDRGELERLVDVAVTAGPAVEAYDRRPAPRRAPDRVDDRAARWDEDDDDAWDTGGRSRAGAAPKRRGGLFRDLFEGFGD